MSKSGLLKSNWVYVNPTETRVIDTNAMVESKLKELSEKLSAQTRTDDEFADGFTQGIDAKQVAELVGEDNQIIGGNAPVEPQGPTQEELMQQAAAEIENRKQQAIAEIQNARQQAVEEGRKQGYQEGLEQGHQDGYAQGHQEGLDSVAQQQTALNSEYEAKAAQLEEEYSSKVKELEPKFIDTLTDIYEHIFQISLKNSRELVVHLLANTMRNLEGGNGYLIHVSKDDYPFVSMQKKELVKGTSIDPEDMDIIEDATLDRSECMIETGNGVFDCSLGTQLEALNEELRLLAYEPSTTDRG